ELEDLTGIAWGITRLGYVAHWQKEYAAALALFDEALPLWRELEQNDGLAETLFHLAQLRRQKEDYPSAYTLIEELAAVMREGNSDATGPFALLGLAAADLGRWEEAAAHCGKRLRLCRAGDELRHGHIVARALTVMAR